MPDFGYLKYEIKERWERLAIREWLSRSPKLVIGVSTVSFVVLVGVLIWLSLLEKVVVVENYEKDWYYDLKHRRLFVERKGQIPPIEAPSGPLANGEPAGVRAYVFTYSNDPNTTKTFIGFLETTDPNVDKSSLGSVDLRVSGAEIWGKGRLVRRVRDEKWVPANSEEGRAILKETFRQNEKGEMPHYLPPK
ncbi:MAG: hypothetical protein WAV28_06250 [Sedimentisphaerales bacterium]